MSTTIGRIRGIIYSNTGEDLLRDTRGERELAALVVRQHFRIKAFEARPLQCALGTTLVRWKYVLLNWLDPKRRTLK